MRMMRIGQVLLMLLVGHPWPDLAVHAEGCWHKQLGYSLMLRRLRSNPMPLTIDGCSWLQLHACTEIYLYSTSGFHVPSMGAPLHKGRRACIC